MHRLLQRQLRRFLETDEEFPEELERFVQAVDAAYHQADDDRALLERSLELTSQELINRNEQLRIRRKELEQMVGERTAELEFLTIHLQTAAEIARDATTTQNLDELLTNAVTLVRERFGFYHTAIYLTDERGKYAILMSATGEVGQRMVAEEFHLMLDKNSLVGQAALSGKSFNDFSADSDEEQRGSALLPETRSELALPLRVGDHIIGAFNVHSREDSAFDQQITSVLQTLADQLAVAISNTRLLQEMGQTLRELEVATGSYTQEAWKKVTQRSAGLLGFRYRGLGIEPITEDDQPVSASQDDETTKLTVPIRLRDQIIGTLNLQVEENEALPETKALAESVAERMALAIENARLLEDTQRRADRERMVSSVTSRIRQTLDVDSVLRSAANEIREAMGLHDVVIRLAATDLPPQETPIKTGDNGDSPNDN
ncbi:MAG: GAF domain-containing protein [Anaerolineales bacterium]|nr:GAF domain-containing protein [Chloroflexota bacterium]MBL6979731.1 GAF domain-containing protein [Anaerolineales bacterium]